MPSNFPQIRCFLLFHVLYYLSWNSTTSAQGIRIPHFLFHVVQLYFVFNVWSIVMNHCNNDLFVALYLLKPLSNSPDMFRYQSQSWNTDWIILKPMWSVYLVFLFIDFDVNRRAIVNSVLNILWGGQTKHCLVLPKRLVTCQCFALPQTLDLRSLF